MISLHSWDKHPRKKELKNTENIHMWIATKSSVTFKVDLSSCHIENYIERYIPWFGEDLMEWKTVDDSSRHHWEREKFAWFLEIWQVGRYASMMLGILQVGWFACELVSFSITSKATWGLFSDVRFHARCNTPYMTGRCISYHHADAFQYFSISISISHDMLEIFINYIWISLHRLTFPYKHCQRIWKTWCTRGLQDPMGGWGGTVSFLDLFSFILIKEDKN